MHPARHGSLRFDRARAWATMALVAVAPCVAACRRPLTELIVVVDSDLCAPGAIDRLVVTPGVDTRTRTFGPSDVPAFPYTLSLVDDGSPGFAPTIEAIAWRGSTPRVTQSWSTHFVAGESRVLLVTLSSACEDVACDDGRTCVAGACVPNVLDPASLPVWTGSPPVHTGSCMPSVDVATVDATDAMPCDAALQSDPAHCGACDHACPSGIACIGGVCSNQVRQVGGGMDFACMVRSDQRVYCWGANNFGQLGNGSMDASPVPTVVASLEHVQQIAVGAEHVCATMFDGTVSCWGRGNDGELGDGTTVGAQPRPVRVPGITSVVQMVSGSWNTCVLRGDESTWCWGLGLEGELGDGAGMSRASPVLLPSLRNLRDIACGGHHCCSLASSGVVSCWGLNDNGQIGDGTLGGMRTTPVAVATPTGVVHVVAGYQHSCALLGSGSVYCWGSDGTGQLGDATVLVHDGLRAAPGPAVLYLADAAALSAGANHTCALERGGTMVCWGENMAGQLGNGDMTTQPAPVAVTGLTGVQVLGTGYYESCAVNANGLAVWCWGDNSHAQLGAGLVRSNAPTPQRVVGVP